MLGRLAYVLRCLPEAHRSLLPHATTIPSAQYSHASEAAEPASWTTSPIALSRAEGALSPETPPILSLASLAADLRTIETRSNSASVAAVPRSPVTPPREPYKKQVRRRSSIKTRRITARRRVSADSTTIKTRSDSASLSIVSRSPVTPPRRPYKKQERSALSIRTHGITLRKIVSTSSKALSSKTTFTSLGRPSSLENAFPHVRSAGILGGQARQVRIRKFVSNLEAQPYKIRIRKFISNLEAQPYKIRIRRSPSDRWRDFVSTYSDVLNRRYSRGRSRISFMPSSLKRNQPMNLAQQRYLEHPRIVSLGSWGSYSKTLPENPIPQTSRDGLDEHDSVWSTSFMRLEKGYRIDTWKTPNVQRFALRFTSFHGRKTQLRQLWENLPVQQQLDLWRDSMLWCLERSPKRALTLLDDIFKRGVFKPPRYMIEDCLHFLARHYLFGIAKANPLALSIIQRVTISFVEGASTSELRYYSISQDVVQLLLKHSEGAQALILYETLVANRAVLHPNTTLHFIEIFVDMGLLDLSMKLLKRVVSSPLGRQITSSPNCPTKDQIQSACVRLLCDDWKVEKLADRYRLRSLILTQVLKMGVSPNTIMYNAILSNMIDGGDFDTAWRTYDIVKQSNHLKPDSTTYVILAKGARLSGESSILDRVLRETHEDPSMLEDPRLVSSMLHAVGELAPGDSFLAMLDLYKLHLDPRPLQDLSIFRSGSDMLPEGDCNGKWPDHHILGQMILAYNKSDVSPDSLVQNYNLYHGFVQNEHPLIACLARNEYVANSFIMAFGKHMETLEYCTTVLKHMLSTPPSPDAAPYAAPTVCTWSILIHAYMRHGQKHAAEKVLKMMDARGLKPDHVTWNTLISGYAGMQDIEGAADAVKRMTAQGFETNSRTLKGLGKIWDQQRLLNKLKANIKAEEERQQIVTYSDLKKLVNPEEVGEITEEWETEDQLDREEEIERYLQNYY